MTLLVVRSVNYADYLEVTLPRWVNLLGRESVCVVTDKMDKDSEAVAKRFGTLVHRTDAWHKLGSGSLDGGSAADEAFAAHNPSEGEVMISADADSYPVGESLAAVVESGVIYGCARHDCPTPEVLDQFVRGKLTRQQIPIIPQRGHKPELVLPWTDEDVQRWGSRCLGFFQMWAHRDGLKFGSHRAAGGYDTAFAKKFARRQVLKDFWVLHLGPRTSENWTKRVVPEWK